ncbi:MAG: radical SAM protein [bacterium]|nr:radical SAM protein [bacterium]
MKILLIQPPHYYLGKSRSPSFFPIGMGHIAKVLLNSGHTVEILDIYAYQYTNEEVIKRLEKSVNDIVCISSFSTQYNYVKWIAQQIKKMDPHKKIIVGGALATFNSRVLLETTDVDICVIGEGEITIKELIENFDNLKNVKGICFKEKQGEILTTLTREYIKNLDEIPFPAYELFPMEIYINNLNVEGIKEKLRTANIICGRGCPYSCYYCSKVFSGVRLRSVDNFIKEISWLKDKYKIEGVFFNDELLIVNKKRTIELCERLADLKIKWNCQGRVNTLDPEILRIMKKSGCTAVGYGIESGSQRILDAMNKKVSVRQAKEIIIETKKAGLYPMIQMMFGYPGEDMQTLNETVNFFKEIDDPGTNLNYTTPLPGTKLWEYTLQKGLIKDEKYLLENLEGGYSSDAPFLVNYTDFPNDHLETVRETIQKKIRRNYIKRHPLKIFLHNVNRLFTSLHTHGIRITFTKIIRKLFIF